VRPLILLSLFLSSAAIAFGEQADVQLWSVHSMEKVDRLEAPDASGKTLQIAAARNEWEPFQVVVTASSKKLREGRVELSTFQGPDGAQIEGVQIFYEHYVRVSTPSEKSAFAAGMHPDALVPVTPGETIYQPVTELPEADRLNQPFWIDLRVPKDAPVGEYTAQFRFVTAAGEVSQLPVSLEVWDFELPDRVTLASAFGLDPFRLRDMYQFDHGTPWFNRIIRDYEDLLADHKLSPEGYWGVQEAVDADTGFFSLTRSSQPVLGTPEDIYYHFLEEKHLAAALPPFWPDWPFADPLEHNRLEAQRYLANFAKAMERFGWEDYVYVNAGYVDEPASREEYNTVRDWGRFYDETQAIYNVSLPVCVTEQPAPENRLWGSLHGSVDIWVTYVGDLWEDMHGAKTGHVASRREAGDQIWIYMSLVQAPSKWLKQNGSPEALTEGHPPVWLTDYAPMNFRVWSWIAPVYDVTGILYWATVDWRDGVNPWEDAGVFAIGDSIYNGDGQLIYPGFKEKVGFDGPVASMRLKWIREAMEDHAYLTLLQDRGLGEFAREYTSRFARNMGDWENDPEALFEMRRVLAEKLSETSSEPPSNTLTHAN